MLFVASQIAIWIVVSTLFGFLVGWIARGRRVSGRSKRRRFR